MLDREHFSQEIYCLFCEIYKNHTLKFIASRENVKIRLTCNKNGRQITQLWKGLTYLIRYNNNGKEYFRIGKRRKKKVFADKSLASRQECRGRECFNHAMNSIGNRNPCTRDTKESRVNPFRPSSITGN